MIRWIVFLIFVTILEVYAFQAFKTLVKSKAFFVFYFITSTILFSGVLGCGRIPILGGRPYELRKEAAEKNNVDQTDDSFEDDVYSV